LDFMLHWVKSVCLFFREPHKQSMNHITMKQLPAEERPYEKCISIGAEALTDSELLAVILRTGTKDMNSLTLAGNVLAAAGESAASGLPGLYHLSVQDLMAIPGIGRVKAVQLKCIGELSRRIAAASARQTLDMSSPQSIAEYYMEKLRHEEQEHLYSLMLDARSNYMGERMLSRGTANAALITPREIFAEALRRQALGIVIIHNHPSGDPSPSDCDIDVTSRVQHSGAMLGIQLLDHIVIGDHKYFSFREQGLIFNHDI